MTTTRVDLYDSFKKHSVVRAGQEGEVREYMVVRRRRNKRKGELKVWMVEMQPNTLDALAAVRDAMQREG